MDFEQILNTRCFFGNLPPDPEVQTQPWILIVSRGFHRDIEKARRRGKGVDIDSASRAAPTIISTTSRRRAAPRCFRSIIGTKIPIPFGMESTADVLIKEATDTGGFTVIPLPG